MAGFCAPGKDTSRLVIARNRALMTPSTAAELRAICFDQDVPFDEKLTEGAARHRIDALWARKARNQPA